ncbi:MAG: hypothetical protein RR835_03980 [Peptostreptococcaceae bacterium]
MELKEVLQDLEKRKIDLLNKIADNPKNSDAKELLNIVELAIKAFEKEGFKIKKEIEAFGFIEIAIGDYRFTKDERIVKGISVYKVDTDGLYEYIETIKTCKVYLDTINDIESLKGISSDWYRDNILK